jgi:cytosine/adenosine deaminase-related metal-dependent hydrolase
MLHNSIAYTRSSLSERIHRFIAESEMCGVTRVDSFVDVTTDVPLAGGLGALEVALEVKRAFLGRVDFRVGAYAPFGFRQNDTREIELFEHAITLADFIGTSPERDDPSFYRAEPDHIGLQRHLEWTLAWAVANEKPIHYHLDQQVNPNERGTEALINAIQRSALRERIVALGTDEPLVWAVHCISPSTYARTRRETLATKMAELRVGLVCCPSAALSMRTLSIFDAPVHKSIADVLLLLDHGVIVRLGTDNVDDIFLPATVLDPRRELATLADALRFYHVAILAKIACGKALSVEEREAVASHLENERQYVESLRGVGPFPFEV